MATVLEELLIKVGVEVDEKELKSFEKTSNDAVNTLKKMAVAASVAAAAMVAYSLKMAKVTDANAKFARSAGLSFEALQELDFAARREGAGVGEMASTLGNLNRAIGQLAIGRGPQEAVRRIGGLGASFDDLQSGALDAIDFLEIIGEKIQGMAPARQAEIVGQFGISQNILQLLQQGRFSIAELRKEARKMGVESEEFARRQEKLNDSLTNNKQKINQALLPLRLMISEVILKVIPAISAWIEKNKELIPQIVKIGGIALAVFGGGAIIASWVSKIFMAVKAVKGLAVAFGLLSAAKSAAGIAGVGSGIGAGAGGLAGGGAIAGGLAAAGTGLLVAGAVAATAFGAKKYLDRIARKPTGGSERFVSVARRVNSQQESTRTENVTFNINGVTDPTAVAQAVDVKLSGIFRSSQKDFEQGAF